MNDPTKLQPVSMADKGQALLRMLDSAQSQDWPAPALYVVATPIGNLSDLTLRAYVALCLADCIAAEDTRSTRVLLDAWGIPARRLLAAHQHNEHQAATSVLAALTAGERVVLVSDAGTPGVSDPGARLVADVREAGHRVIPLPGPSAAMAAISTLGWVSSDPGFVFAGFPPSRASERERWWGRWADLPVPVVFYESPHRLQACLAGLRQRVGPWRRVFVGRELTKRHEQLCEDTVAGVLARIERGELPTQGEFVLVLQPAVSAAHGAPDIEAWCLDLLDLGLSVRDISRVVAQRLGCDRQQVYSTAQALRDARSDQR
jgi:16S rRNA (cytidine1402-2'-O)-methyltransferase